MSRQALHSRPALSGVNVLEWLASGMTTEEILADFDDLQREDILAALSYDALLTHKPALSRSNGLAA